MTSKQPLAPKVRSCPPNLKDAKMTVLERRKDTLQRESRTTIVKIEALIY